MCDFCDKFDFGTATCEVDKYGARLKLAGGFTRFPVYEQFQFCPKCGASRVDRNRILPALEKRQCPPSHDPVPFLLMQ